MGLYEETPAPAGAGVSRVAAVVPGRCDRRERHARPAAGQGQAGAHSPTADPGCLRMAMSATKAMATFVGSGMKTTPRRSPAEANSNLCGMRAPHGHALQDLRLLHARENQDDARRLPDREVAGVICLRASEGDLRRDRRSRG